MYRAFVQAVEDDRADIPADELHHLLRVRRSRDGDDFLGFDPDRGWLRCRLRRDGRQWFAQLLGPVDEQWESPLRVILGQALIKKDRFEWVVQKAVELGADKIVPLITHRSEVKTERHPERRLARWRKIVAESVKQCGRDRLPHLSEPIPLESFLAGHLPAARLMLDEAGAVPLKAQLCRLDRQPECLLLTGPEGGWDDRDRRLASAVGCLPAKLGPRILRAETAPVAALTVLQYEWGDLGPTDTKISP